MLRKQLRSLLKLKKKQEDKTVLLNIKLNIDSKDEKIKIELIGKIIFALSKLPDDYTKLRKIRWCQWPEILYLIH